MPAILALQANGAKLAIRAEATDEEDSDGGSDTIKRQKTSKSRQTGLRTVKTPNSVNSESSLPTPGPTGGETEGEEGEEIAQTTTVDGGSDEEDDLEADLLAEFEKEEQEASASSDGGG
jgi:RNA polymerase II subunit A-like phosphatase